MSLKESHSLKFYNYDIVFQEVPGEVTLAVNISNCPNHCEGCHSPHLWQDIGEILSETALLDIVAKYDKLITCVCLMGGDINAVEIALLLACVKSEYPLLKTAWYSGKSSLPLNFPVKHIDFLKLGPFMPEHGPLNNPETNQRLFRIGQNFEMEDITSLFWSEGV